MREKILLLCTASLALLSACSASQTYRKDSARLENSVADLRSFQAEQTTQISTLQSQIHRLSGKVEELEYMLKQRGQMAYGSGGAASYGMQPSQEGASSFLPQGGQSAGALESLQRPKLSPPAIVPLASLEDDETFVRSLPANVARTFSQALIKIREGSFQESLSLLQQMVQQGERSEWSPNVLFWLGVTYDGLGEDKNALRAYNDLIVQFPRNKRVPLSMLRQAQALQRLGDRKSANLLLRKIISEYGDSSEAARAREELKKF